MSQNELPLLKESLFDRHWSTIVEKADANKSRYWDAIRFSPGTIDENDKKKRLYFLKYIFDEEKKYNDRVKDDKIRAFAKIGSNGAEIPWPKKIDPTHRRLFDLFMMECIPEGDRSPREDPHVTGGIKNWLWAVLFIFLAAIPLLLALPSVVDRIAKTTDIRHSATPSPGPLSEGAGEREKLALQSAGSRQMDSEKFALMESRIDDMYSTVQAVGLSSGLFGVLITIMVLFFALKESERVKDALNRIKEIEDVYRTFEGIQAQAKDAKDDARHAIDRARHALAMTNELATKAEGLEHRVTTAVEKARQETDKIVATGITQNKNIYEEFEQIKNNFNPPP